MAHKLGVFLVFLLMATASTAADTPPIAHKSCTIRAHDPEVFLAFFIPSFIQEKTSKETYTDEAQRMFQEVQDGILNAKLTKTLRKRLREKGYTLTLVDGQETRQFVENNQQAAASTKPHIMGIVSSADELILSYGLSFNFATKPVRNDRSFTWRIALNNQQDAQEFSQQSTTLFRFSSTEIAKIFKDALAKIPPCEIVVTDDDNEKSTSSKQATTDKSRRISSSSSDTEV